ncbi:phage tail spike protein [Paenibacillus pinihumi]|uniref:phage tail spike protein n=1 Tax=Paenibacillus pinihumi TaxID=669462 RepID=UPI000412B279|nr:phage tail spike protein [Paenibacillus pinihumi]
MSKWRSKLELHTAEGRSILAAAKEVVVTETLNGEYYVTFTYPKVLGDVERYAGLTEGSEVRFPQHIERGQRFTIRKVDEFRRGQQMYKTVEAHHVAFNLGNYFYDDYIDFAAAKDITEMLGLLAADTPFSFVVEGTFAKQDIFEWGEARRIDLLQNLRELYGAELSFDNYEIMLTSRKGNNYGAEIRYRKNSAGIKRNSHTMERVTRLYGYGKNGLTIEGLPGRSVKYIDSKYFDPAAPLEGKVDFPEIDDQARLLAEMQKYLATVELPKVSYEVEFVQLEKVDDDFYEERIREVGDTVTVTDEPLGYRFDARVHQYVRYPFEPKRARIVLANFRELTTADYIFRATVGSRKAIEYTSRNAILKGVKYDDSITVADGFGITVSDDFNRKRVILGQYEPGKYGLLVLNKAGTRTIWLDDSTGNAVFAGTLEAAAGTFRGTVQAGKVIGSEINGSTITGTTMSASNINGTFITGGSVIGSQIRTAGSYPMVELSSTGNVFTAASNAGNRIQIDPNYAGTPTLDFVNSGDIVGRINTLTGTLEIYGKNQLRLNSIYTEIVGNVEISSWGNLLSRAQGHSLATALAAKLNIGATMSNVTAGGHNHGIPDGTRLAICDPAGNVVGYLTWSAYGGFTHTHTLTN